MDAVLARTGAAEDTGVADGKPPLPGPHFFDERAETMPRGDIRAKQEALLFEAIGFAYDKAPLIRTTWEAAGIHPRDVRSMSDYAALAPFINKDAVRAFRDAHSDPTGGLRAVPDTAVYRIGTSSGTTGDPTPEFRPRFQPGGELIVRDLWHIGMRPGDHIIYPLFTFRGGVTPPVFSYAGFIPITFAHAAHEVPRIIEASLRYRPVSWFTASTVLINAFELEFERTDIDPVDVFSSYRGVIFGGEMLSRRQKALAESWGLRLYEITAGGDIGAAISCSVHDGCHVWEDYGLYEVLDVDGRGLVADGEVGELVVTSFDPFSPLIRSRSDDLVTMDRSPCTCGRTHARIKTVGRKGDRTTVNGKLILPRHVHEVIETHHPTRAALYQIIRTQAEMDTLRLRIGNNPNLLTGSIDQLRADLHDHLVAELDVPVEIEMVLDAELLKLGPPHKIPRVTKS